MQTYHGLHEKYGVAGALMIFKEEEKGRKKRTRKKCSHDF
jgi:hypothetical protein